jgi:hypothetical protein
LTVGREELTVGNRQLTKSFRAQWLNCQLSIVNFKEIMAKREIKKVDPFSLAKVLGILYALLGVIIGLMFAAWGSVMSNLHMAESDETTKTILSFFGIGSIIFFPILYGIIGLVAGVITAALYNVVARWVGGVMIEIGE